MMASFGNTNVDMIRCMRRLMENPRGITPDEWAAATAMVRKFEDFKRLYEQAYAERQSTRSNVF